MQSSQLAVARLFFRWLLVCIWLDGSGHVRWSVVEGWLWPGSLADIESVSRAVQMRVVSKEGPAWADLP
jgi:hypothetical protein